MSEEQGLRVRRARRSRAEIEQLVEEFGRSGLRQGEFCRRRGMVLNTLKRYLKRVKDARREPAGSATLVAVEVATPAKSESASGMAVVLRSGHRIEVSSDFDTAALARLVTVLERL